MGRVNVKNGAPVGNEHLCRPCSNGQYTVGYRESDVPAICANSNPSRVLPFPVCECTDFQGRNRPDWEQMQKPALSFGESHRKPVRGFSGSGFSRVPPVAEDESKDEEEVALAR